jgi:hypothetical protein
MRRHLVPLVVLLCFGLTTYGSAQTSNATLGGTVSDTTRALIPGVTITATNTQTGVIATAVSNEAGAYQFASLQTGIYKVSAELPGFQIQTYNNVVLGLGQQVRLNFTLQVGSVAQAVEVTVAADTLIATTSASVGTVLPEYKVRDLPLQYRNVLDLASTTPGAVGDNFAGARTSSVATVRDGIVVSDLRYNHGVYSVTYSSSDLVEEVRVIVAPADAETGRGSGQVQMVTRSGTNQFRGALFWMNFNSALSANSWFGNFRGEEPGYLNQNQFGGRLGGPLVRNKTFFFFLFEGQRFLERAYTTGTVLTEQARSGLFRYFPGAQNANAFANNPTVDLQGNPVRPSAATGELQSFSVFGRDPLRTGFDPSGWVQKVLARMPLPNDFTVGDGLNTAGHRWVQRTSIDSPTGNGSNSNRNQYNVRIDHNVNANHKLSFVGSREKTWTEAWPPPWPSEYIAKGIRHPYVYSGSFVSTLSPTIVNELRVGVSRTSTDRWSSFERPDEIGREAFALLPQINGLPVLPKHILFAENFISHSIGNTGAFSNPLTQYSDTLSWTRSRHAFKAGGEFRFSKTDGWNAEDILPRAFFGAGSVPVTGIDASTVPGLAAADQTLARNMLLDLSGSVGSANQAFPISGPKDPTFLDWRELPRKDRSWHQNEFSAFFKDDWKIRPNLTLNVGIRYDWYGVPYEGRGLAAAPIGGSAGLFGISGTDFADMWQPGRLNGSLTKVEFVGKNSPNPDKLLHNNDWNNFAPALGFSWSIPWLGRDKTVLRAGYGMNYQRGINMLSLDSAIGNLPGVHAITSESFADYRNLTTLTLPLRPSAAPLQPVPLTSRTQSMTGWDNNRVTPYIQNWNLELQRELVRNLTLEVRYIGSKGTKLWGGIPLNEVNIFENGILEAFNTTRAGGNASLFDQMLRGLNLGSGVINGTTVTGSQSLRQNTLFRTHIANGNVGQFAGLLNSTNTVTGENGGLLRRNGFAENFIVVNPQFSNVTMNGNPGNSTYHALQMQVTKRLAQGFTNQTSYTWSRSIGDSDGDGTINYRNGRDRSSQKALLSYHRTHNVQSNGTFELPFGPNRRLLGNAPALISRLIERWQLGAIFSWRSGQPLNITAPASTFNQFTTGTPMIVGDFPKSSGKVTITDEPGVITYFPGLKQVRDDAARAGVTTSQATQGSFSNLAITDADGRVLLVNPQPGELGNLGLFWVEGPGRLGLDMNLIKRVRIGENKEFQLRVDAINVLNTPQWGNPNLNINNSSFGRITTTGSATAGAGSAAGARTFAINLRVDF